eukprot:COSAG01_NODE_150_length_23941_cov_44.277200_5_plen_62_part_00
MIDLAPWLLALAVGSCVVAGGRSGCGMDTDNADDAAQMAALHQARAVASGALPPGQLFFSV